MFSFSFCGTLQFAQLDYLKISGKQIKLSNLLHATKVATALNMPAERGRELQREREGERFIHNIRIMKLKEKRDKKTTNLEKKEQKHEVQKINI